jgi:transcriptional regulator with XRE-family HTH domain
MSYEFLDNYGCILLPIFVFYNVRQVIYKASLFIFTKTKTMTEKTIHEGRNVKRIREILGIKQDTLANELGLSQQAISALEQKEKIDDKIMADVAKALGISADAIKNFDEQATFNIISNTYHDNSASVHYTFNPMEKIVELYEALLKSEREKVALLEKMLDKK